MKRMLVITVLAALLLSTVGASIAVAKDNQPAGKSNVYQYTITTQPSGNGKLVLNTKTGAFTFAGQGYAPGTYYLYYMAGGARVDLVPDGVAAAADGILSMAGTFDKKALDQVKMAVVSTTPSLAVTIDGVNMGNGVWMLTATVTGTDPNNIVDWHWQAFLPDGRIVGDVHSGPTQPSYPTPYPDAYAVVTVTDSNGQTATSPHWTAPST